MLRILPLLLGTLAFGECAPVITVPLPELCKRVEGQQLPGYPGLPRDTYETEYVIPLGDALQTDDAVVGLTAWLTRAQLTAPGGELGFVEELAISAVPAEGFAAAAPADVATFTRGDRTDIRDTIQLAPAGGDLVPYVTPDGTLRIRLRFVGQPPVAPLQVNLTACVAGEAEYALGR